MTQVVFLNSGPQNIWLHRYVGPYKQSYWLRKHGYSTQVIDHVSKLSLSDITKILDQHLGPDTLILGISTTFMGLSALTQGESKKYPVPLTVVKALQYVRGNWPQVRIITGGYNSEIMDLPCVDAAVQSYAVSPENIILDLLEHLQDPQKNLEPPHILYFTKLGQARRCYNQSTRQEYHIEQDDFTWSDQDHILKQEPLPLDVSRGCIFRCSFCRYPHLGKRSHDYVRDWALIEREIRDNYDRWGTTDYYILDDTFNDSPKKVQQLLDLKQRLPFDFGWVGYLRADLIWSRPETAVQIQDSGCRGAYFGIESLDPQASKCIGKGWSGQHAATWIPKLYHEIWGGKLPIHCNFIVGLPYETEDSVRRTAAWVRDNKIYSGSFYPLHIDYHPPNSTNHRAVSSQFDLELERWGFRWITFTEWANDQWTHSKAVKVCGELNDIVGPEQQRNIWNLLQAKWLGHPLAQSQTRLGLKTLLEQKMKNYTALLINAKS